MPARGLGFWGNEYSSGRAGLCFCLLSREGLGFRFTLTPAGTASRYPAPAPVSLAPAAQLLLPSSPGPAVPGAAPWRLPRLPQAPLRAAPALSPFSREGLPSSCGSQDHRYRPRVGGGKPRCSQGPVLPPWLTSPAARESLACGLPPSWVSRQNSGLVVPSRWLLGVTPGPQPGAPGGRISLQSCSLLTLVEREPTSAYPQPGGHFWLSEPPPVPV